MNKILNNALQFGRYHEFMYISRQLNILQPRHYEQLCYINSRAIVICNTVHDIEIMPWMMRKIGISLNYYSHSNYRDIKKTFVTLYQSAACYKKLYNS